MNLSEWTEEDALEARALRDRYSIGIYQARKILIGRRLRTRTEAAQSVEDLRSVVLDLVEQLYSDMPGLR